jgi:hypothetical protein
MIHMMCALYINTECTPPSKGSIQALSALLNSVFLKVFFTLFVKLGHNHWWHLTETIRIWSFYVSSIYDTNMEGMRVESR